MIVKVFPHGVVIPFLSTFRDMLRKLAVVAFFVGAKGMTTQAKRSMIRLAVDVAASSSGPLSPLRLATTETRMYHLSGHRSKSPLGRIQKSGVALSSSSSSSSDSVAADELMDEDEILDDGEDDQSSATLELPKGSTEGFYVVREYPTEPGGFDMDAIRQLVDNNDIERLELTSQNISVPVALMMLDGVEFPSRSRARKSCRNGNIMIHRGPLVFDKETGKNVFDSSRCIRARVGDRVFPGDVLGKQVRMGDGYFPVMHHKRPPFDLPVIFEDDHFAICNKPAGVVVYANRGGGYGLLTIRAALPFAVKPPKIGTVSTLRRPQPVHRLDKPTSGLLLVAKTKPAMVNLAGQFRDRVIRKTYTALVNGIPPELSNNKISSKEAHEMGVDVDPTVDIDWQLIDHPLDEKSAVTIWRATRYAKSLKAFDNYVTLVELKPKTGRYHQLRRHMVCPL